jgi:hypothetical protein
MRLPLLIVALSVSLAISSQATARKWTDVTGQYHVEAELAGVIAGTVQLKTSDGRTIKVPIEKLSETDRRYIESRRKSGSRPSKPNKSESPKRTDEPTAIRSGLATIEQALPKQSNYEFVETRLEDAIKSLEQQHRVKFYIDKQALDDVGISTGVPLTAKGSDPLEKVLERILRPLDLAWTIRDEVLMITTAKRAERYVDVLVYKFVQPLPNVDALINDIQKNIAPTRWDKVGGSGSIEFWPGGAIVVAQSYPIHRQLQQKYAQTMKAIARPETRPAARRPTLGSPKLLSALAGPSACDFVETSLHALAAQLAKQHSIKIVLDEQALNDVGMGTDMPVTCRLGSINLESALNLMLGQLDLAWTVDRDVLTITTGEGDETRLLQVNYEVRDLVMMVRGDVDSLLEILTGTVAPASWDRVGGPGSIQVGANGLLVRQTFQNHRRIQRLLDDLREVHKR